MKNLNNLLDKMHVLNLSNATYYNLIDFDDILVQLGDRKIEVDEHIITPFYICNQMVLELYHFSLTIRHVKAPDIDNFILRETGRKSMDEVDPSIKLRFQRCYLETIAPNKSIPANKLQSFTNYVRNSVDIAQLISDYLHDFEEENLYFEIY